MGIDGISNADIIDIRPRVADYIVSESTRSPLEFYGRTFNNEGQTANNILASDEAIIATFSHYLGRIDRIFVTKDGKFEVKNILMEGIEKNLLLLYSGRNILRLLPPLVISEGDVTRSLEILDELLTNEENRRNG